MRWTQLFLKICLYYELAKCGVSGRLPIVVCHLFLRTGGRLLPVFLADRCLLSSLLLASSSPPLLLHLCRFGSAAPGKPSRWSSAAPSYGLHLGPLPRLSASSLWPPTRPSILWPSSFPPFPPPPPGASPFTCHVVLVEGVCASLMTSSRCFQQAHHDFYHCY